MKLLLPLLSLSLTACFYGHEFDWADRDQIVAAAARCGLPGFEPTPADEVYAAYVPETVPDAKRKEDCIYRDLDRQGLLATR